MLKQHEEARPACVYLPSIRDKTYMTPCCQFCVNFKSQLHPKVNDDRQFSAVAGVSLSSGRISRWCRDSRLSVMSNTRHTNMSCLLFHRQSVTVQPLSTAELCSNWRPTVLTSEASCTHRAPDQHAGVGFGRSFLRVHLTSWRDDFYIKFMLLSIPLKSVRLFQGVLLPSLCVIIDLG